MFDCLAGEVVCKALNVKEFMIPELIRLLRAFSIARLSHPSLFETCAVDILSRDLSAVSLADLTAILRTFAQVDFLHSRLFQKVR